jgi:prepilin-type N-terminal cleavage/methylation domain-containing protein
MRHRIVHTSRAGFSLIELLVSIFIVGVLMSLVLVNFRTGRYQDELRFAAENLASDIRELQNFALTGFIPGSSTGTVPDGGFGFYVMVGEETYSLYADRSEMGCVPNRRYLDQGGAAACIEGDDEDELLSGGEKRLGQSVQVKKALAGAGCPDNEQEVDIVFSPPRASTFFCGAHAGGSASIELFHDRTQDTRTVVVNGVTGRVSIE